MSWLRRSFVQCKSLSRPGGRCPYHAHNVYKKFYELLVCVWFVLWLDIRFSCWIYCIIPTSQLREDWDKVHPDVHICNLANICLEISDIKEILIKFSFVFTTLDSSSSQEVLGKKVEYHCMRICTIHYPCDHESFSLTICVCVCVCDFFVNPFQNSCIFFSNYVCWHKEEYF